MTPIYKVLKNKDTTIKPIWIMRQAGRYLPEFREIRNKNPDFWPLAGEGVRSSCGLLPSAEAAGFAKGGSSPPGPLVSSFAAAAHIFASREAKRLADEVAAEAQQAKSEKL